MLDLPAVLASLVRKAGSGAVPGCHRGRRLCGMPAGAQLAPSQGLLWLAAGSCLESQSLGHVCSS